MSKNERGRQNRTKLEHDTNKRRITKYILIKTNNNFMCIKYEMQPG